MKKSTFQYPKTKTISAIKKAAKELDLEIEEGTTNELTLYHGGGLLSYGNIITVKISSNDTLETQVSISSRSAAQIQLIDWGTNERLESDLMSAIKDIIA